MAHDPYLFLSHLPSFLPGMGAIKGSSPSLRLSLAFSTLISCCLLSASHVRKNQSYAGKSYLLLNMCRVSIALA